MSELTKTTSKDEVQKVKEPDNTEESKDLKLKKFVGEVNNGEHDQAIAKKILDSQPNLTVEQASTPLGETGMKIYAGAIEDYYYQIHDKPYNPNLRQDIFNLDPRIRDYLNMGSLERIRMKIVELLNNMKKKKIRKI